MYLQEAQALLKKYPNKGYGEVRLKNPKATGSITVREYTDENGEVIHLLNSKGVPRVVKITKAKTVYDFSKENDRLEFFHIVNHPIYMSSSSPIIDCINLQEIAEEEVQIMNRFADALILIRRLKGAELRDFARILLVNRRISFTNNTSDSILLKHVYDIAESDPDRVINEYEHPDKEYKILLLTGLEKQVFTNESGVWRFGATTMGTNFDLAVEFLKENQDMLPGLRKEVNAKK